jgi:hypothetical protein
VNACGDAIGLDPRSTARTIGQQRSRSSAAQTAQGFAEKGKTRSRVRLDAVVSAEAHETTTLDDDQERRGRLPLLGKAAVLAHRFARPLAAELDEYEQR